MNASRRIIRRQLFALSLAVLSLCAPPLHAEEAGARAAEELAPGFAACVEKSGGSTVEMAACGQAAYEYWDAQLNAEYRKARQACAEQSCRDALQKMQRAWIQYKETTVALLFRGLNRDAGSMGRLDAGAFAAEETKKQTKLLRELVRGSGVE